MRETQYKKDTQYFMLAVLMLLAVRLIVSWYLPLTDNTEARYGEIARLMYETKNWIVLYTDYNFPFWGKPPLSTWLSVMSITIFGLNEFALRLPTFLLSIFIVLLVAKVMSFDKRRFWLFSLFVFFTPEFIIHAGVLSTDTALNFSIVLVMISFWKAVNQSDKSVWGYLFFVGLALGCLAKGPITFVLVGPPIFIWCFTQKAWKQVWQGLPWLLGVLLFALIAIPWYYLAEIHSPQVSDFCVNIPKDISPSTRFLDYFIVGEHFDRYIKPGWSGDLYGGGHHRIFGTVWLYLLLFIPQVCFVIYKVIKYRSFVFKDRWLSFLVFWLFWDPIFFTFSSNILHTYTLPCVVPSVLLLMHWVDRHTQSILRKTGLIMASLLLGSSVIFYIFLPKLGDSLNSDKLLINRTIESNSGNKDVAILYWKSRTFSGQFYTHGKAKVITSIAQFEDVEKLGKPFYLFVKKGDVHDLKLYSSSMKLLDSNQKNNLYWVIPK